MKKNSFIFIVAIVLAIIAVFLIYTTTKSTIPKALKNFAIEDTTMITKIFLTDKSNNKVLLEKKAQGDWITNRKYNADNGMINILLKTMIRLEVKSPVAKAARNNVIKRLSSIGVKVEIYQTTFRIDLWGIKMFEHEKLVKTYYVGDATMDNMGTYMLMDGSDEPFIMYIPGFRGFLYSRYSTLESDWRSHTIFSTKVPGIKSVTIEFPSAPENTFKAENTGNAHYTLTALSPVSLVADYDTLRLLQFLSAFSDICFEAIITDTTFHEKDSILATKPFHIITLTDQSGKKQIVKTFHKKAEEGQIELDGTSSLYDKDRLYALFNDGKDLAFVQFYVFDNIVRPLSYFIKTEGKK